jgi:flagella basal body P-ring formation protein FlgA
MNRNRNNPLKWLLPAMAAVLTLSSISLADSVRLKRVAIVEPDQKIRLIDVADLEGAYASSLARTVIEADAQKLLGATGSGEISLNRVRAALHESGANLSRLSFSGRSCVLREPAASADARDKEQEDAPEELPWRTVEDWTRASEVTVEIAIVRAFARELKIEPDRLRLRFIDEPQDLLGLSLASQRTMIRPISSLSSPRALLKVERFRNNGSLDRVETVQVEAQVLRPVLRVREQVSRREAIPGGVLEATEEWLAPGTDAVHASEGFEYVGQIATTRLAPGSLLLRSQVEKPIAVSRGATVIVIYHTAGFVLESQGKARDEGRVGEVIEVRLTDSRATVLARVEGPQRVVVIGRGD